MGLEILGVSLCKSSVFNYLHVQVQELTKLQQRPIYYPPPLPRTSPWALERLVTICPLESYVLSFVASVGGYQVGTCVLTICFDNQCQDVGDLVAEGYCPGAYLSWNAFNVTFYAPVDKTEVVVGIKTLECDALYVAFDDFLLLHGNKVPV